jgi:hypothetical protein
MDPVEITAAPIVAQTIVASETDRRENAVLSLLIRQAYSVLVTIC